MAAIGVCALACSGLPPVGGAHPPVGLLRLVSVKLLDELLDRSELVHVAKFDEEAADRETVLSGFVPSTT